LGTVEVRSESRGYLTEVKFDDGDIGQEGTGIVRNRSAPVSGEQDRAQGDYDQGRLFHELATANTIGPSASRKRCDIRPETLTKQRLFLEAKARFFDSSRGAGTCQAVTWEFCRITRPIDGHASSPISP